jgi:hypothetical protein
VSRVVVPRRRARTRSPRVRRPLTEPAKAKLVSARKAADAKAAAPVIATQGVLPIGADEKPPRKKNWRTADSNNCWHVSADWTEAFARVLFDDLDARLRAATLTERARLDALAAAGQRLDRPQVLLIDDIPVYGRAKGSAARRDEGFFLLVAAEVMWAPSLTGDPMTMPVGSTKLRCIRAMPKSNAAAWRLLFDELGYAPDFVVADAGTGIARAVATHFAPAVTTLVPSLWHVANAVRKGLRATPGAMVEGPSGKELRPELFDHVSKLSRRGAASSKAAWSRWWDDLEALCTSLVLPRDKMLARRRNYEKPFALALDRLADYPEVPVSTGGLETVMSRRIEPLLMGRRNGFANIERTNRLFDLAVANEHGVFDDLGDVVTLLRKDAGGYVGRDGGKGWTVPLRAIADPRPEVGRYSSLRDPMLIAELAKARGLT